MATKDINNKEQPMPQATMQPTTKGVFMTTKKPTPQPAGQLLAPCRSAPLEAHTVPSTILLTPWGWVESTNGSFLVDDEAAALAVAAFDQHATDLPIDYEHQSLGGEYAAPNGQAPAAGWIRRIYAQPGVGLLGEIEWTTPAAEQLASRQYRYLSPVALIRVEDRKLTAIHSAALTNKPAIVGMTPIVHRESLNLTPDEAAHSTLALMDDVRLLLRDLSLPEQTGTAELLLAARQEITTLREAARTQRVESQLQEAVSVGKLCEAQRAWARALILKDETLFAEWLRTAPVVVARGALPTPVTNQTEARRLAATARARSEYRTNPMLQRLTTEDAYVADSLAQQLGATHK